MCCNSRGRSSAKKGKCMLVWRCETPTSWPSRTTHRNSPLGCRASSQHVSRSSSDSTDWDVRAMMSEALSSSSTSLGSRTSRLLFVPIHAASFGLLLPSLTKARPPSFVRARRMRASTSPKAASSDSTYRRLVVVPKRYA